MQHPSPPVDANRLRVEVLTPWLPCEEVPAAMREQPDPYRHDLFCRMALRALYYTFPWLAALLEATGGKVLAGHRRFFVTAAASSHDWVEVPELSSHLQLLPWAEGGEVAH